MNSRTAILNRLREAKITPLPEFQSPADAVLYADHPGTEPAQLLEAFAARLAVLKGEMHHVADAAAAGAALQNILGDLPPAKVLVQQAPLINQVLAGAPALDAGCVRAEVETLENHAMADYEIGITVADRLVARTASVLLTNASAAGRRLSVLPPTHIVIATVDQLVPSLEEAFQALPAGAANPGDWSYGVIISGPSRTADIEKILVLGAHGPKRLIVILLDQA